MRQSYVQDPVTLELIPKDDYVRPSDRQGPMIMPDIPGYKSMATGEWISSRSAHREHLKRHGLIEVGNEKIQPKPKGPDRAAIRKVVEEAARRFLD